MNKYIDIDFDDKNKEKILNFIMNKYELNKKNKLTRGFWFFECPICAELDKIHGKCNSALFKLDVNSKTRVCVYYKEIKD
jgi:hypothetical protein